jgi:hypothetical protein
MTITLGENQVYLAVILVLMAIQVYQIKRIMELKKECDKIWEQLGTIVLSISTKMLEMQKEITNKENKK